MSDAEWAEVRAALPVPGWSVKAAASAPAATRGFDGGEKVNGRKRPILVDCLGLLLAMMVTAASVTDRQATGTLLARLTSLDSPWTVLVPGAGRSRGG